MGGSARALLVPAQGATLLGRSPVMVRLDHRIAQAAASMATTLLTGPTGSGKVVVARELHARSARRDGPFVPVNCGGIAESLRLDELFGHVRGAFTGAGASRCGRVGAASGGVLFLDEVDSLLLAAQAELLRFLDDGEYWPLGADEPRRSDAWVVAATNRDLHRLAREGRFRTDLVYRLDRVRIPVPALKDRGGDVLLLADHFLGALPGSSKILGASARSRLLEHSWPGNVRELRACVERAAMAAVGEAIEGEHLDLDGSACVDLYFGGGGVGPNPPPNRVEVGDWFTRERLTWARAQERLQRIAVESALADAGGNREHAAHLLGVSLRTFYRMLERVGLGGK